MLGFRKKQELHAVNNILRPSVMDSSYGAYQAWVEGCEQPGGMQCPGRHHNSSGNVSVMDNETHEVEQS